MELSAFTRSPGESPESFAVRVYDYVFRTKIERLLANPTMTARFPDRNPTFDCPRLSLFCKHRRREDKPKRQRAQYRMNGEKRR